MALNSVGAASGSRQGKSTATRGEALVPGFSPRYPRGPLGLAGRCESLKLPKDHLIINPGSCWFCPSRARGLCEVFNRFRYRVRWACYGDKAEQLYGTPLGFRLYQEHYWRTATVQTFKVDLAALAYEYDRRDWPIRAVRFAEAGDLWSPECIEKLAELSTYTWESFGWSWYGHTARRDLEKYFPAPSRSLVIRGSSWDGPAGRTMVFDRSRGEVPPRGFYVCPLKCGPCTVCTRPGRNVAFPLH